ncbi:MAG TPA: helix-turn-helix domain-containing protein [Blastocatellia bacterium]|nr:helix-turn-helix domain-containing protein [Blastocatellia bacterium]
MTNEELEQLTEAACTDTRKEITMTGEEIRAARLAEGLTQERLGELFGVSKNTIARWERGEVIPQSTAMLRLAFIGLKLERQNGIPTAKLLARVNRGTKKIVRIAQKMRANAKAK